MSLYEKTDWSPFSVRKANKAQLVFVKGFYHIHNVIESLLNVKEMRVGLVRAKLRICDELYDLHAILDECALRICVSPKVIIKKVRTFLSFCVRYAGALSGRQFSMKHCGTAMVKHMPTSSFEWVEIDTNWCKAFANSKFVLSIMKDMREVMSSLVLVRLLNFCAQLQLSIIVT